MEFIKYPKIGRLSKDCTITEKIDGTNAGVYIGEDGEFLVASRSRWITPDNDNYGFARWAYDNKEELLKLGHGMHHGEWWGRGIQRNYGMDKRVFSLFNAVRWTAEAPPSCCSVVPILYQGPFHDAGFMAGVEQAAHYLKTEGSVVAPGYMQPEGVVIHHLGTNTLFKRLLENDLVHKGM